MNAEAARATGDVLLSHRNPGIAVLTLNRPGARNALSLSLLKSLQSQFETLGRDPDISAIILAANGQVFCSGHDLKEMTAHRADPDRGKAFFETTMTTCAAMMQAIVNCPKPVIAAIEAPATAAGCQLVATCDLAVAADTATFATPGVNIGLFCSTPMVALSRNIPRKRAMEMLLTGDVLHSAEAVEYGLINRAVAKENVFTEAMGYAHKIATKSKVTISSGKHAFYRQIEQPLAEAYDYAARVMVENMMVADAEEGICAFIEKRAPSWKDA